MYANDISKWGPKLALTEPSLTSTGYWHSATGDKNPYITLETNQTKLIHTVEIIDRLNGYYDRFEDVEVKVYETIGAEYVSCGNQSHVGGKQI